jgi:hypothetical protein
MYINVLKKKKKSLLNRNSRENAMLINIIYCKMFSKYKVY